jgi:hypothetical protein
MKSALRFLPFFLLIAFSTSCLLAQQTGVLSGQVTDKSNFRPIAGATILVDNKKGGISDSAGMFRITGITPGAHQIKVTSLGYLDENRYNVAITTGNENRLSIELERNPATLGVVTVTSSRKTAVAASLETPLSVQRLTTEEIKSNPGGNFDISRVIQALPGVGGTAGGTGGFRNDIIIRGGSPAENVFYLDGIEIPVINHFQTQGSSGGPTGILNVSFIEDVKLSSSAFDARFDNALSSVFQFKQKTGSPDRVQGNIRLSATELALTLEGPLAKNDRTTFLASVRRSYLQLLFKAIDLPIRPNYWDYQAKITHRLNKKTTLNLLGVGAIDQFSFGVPQKATPEKLYILGNSPSIQQWNYTIGASLRRQLGNGFYTLSLSRNALNNDLEKYDDNDNSNPQKKRLKAVSRETENKLRFDLSQNRDGWKLGYGAVLQYVQFNSNYFNRLRAEVKDPSGVVLQPAVNIESVNDIGFLRYGFYAQAGKRFLDNRLGINAGIRADMNSLINQGNNPLRTLSPRIALSYKVADDWSVNASIGRYFRLPAYTILAFSDNAGKLLNTDARYIRCDHYVAGVEYLPSPSSRFTLEGFYKQYGNYPVSVRDGISLANLGGDFTPVGNEAVVSSGKGRAYGVELFAQQKLTKRFYGVFSYTYSMSRFSGVNGAEVASAWDNRHLLSLLWGYKFNRNWELGLKFRFQGGVPYTPFDDPASRLNYLTLGQGVLDYGLLNTRRLASFSASDVRIDKKYYLRKMTIDVFLDVTNWYGAKNPAYPQYTFTRNADNTDFLTTDGLSVQSDGSNAIPLLLGNDDVQITPTIGFIVEF